MRFFPVWFAVASTLLACRIPNEDHCGRRDADATCAALDPTRPYCSLCEPENDGCVESLAEIPGECRAESSDVGGDMSTDTSAEMSTGTGTSTDDGSETETETETGTETETETETGAETETGSEPECGNGIKEGDEDCDGDDFGDSTCADPYQLPEGMLVCVPGACVIETSQCCLANGQLCESGECCNNNCNALTNKCGL